MIRNPDRPAYPLSGDKYQDEIGRGVASDAYKGLTKREIFCLHNSIPKTGDEELDAIIREGNKRKAAVAAMHGLLANPQGAMTEHSSRTFSPEGISRIAIMHADSLLKQLES